LFVASFARGFGLVPGRIPWNSPVSAFERAAINQTIVLNDLPCQVARKRPATNGATIPANAKGALTRINSRPGAYEK
jgi:hypothetical protein